MNSTQTLSEPWYRSVIRGKTRIALAWIFSILLVLSARSNPAWPGITLCFIGATLRFWASGYLQKDRRICVAGPYGYTRNPLYLGTFLMAIGTALATENLWLAALVTFAFAGVYHFIILDEENKLRGIFGAPYSRYLETVPRFWPRLLPARAPLLDQINPDLEQRAFDWKIAVKNRAHESFVAFAALIGLVWVISLVWSRF